MKRFASLKRKRILSRAIVLGFCLGVFSHVRAANPSDFETPEYFKSNGLDKNHFVLSVGGEAEVAKGWSIGGDASFVRGRHDKDFSCSVTVKRMW